MIQILLLLSFLAFASEPIKVGVMDSPPFSMQENDEWTGISISLWEKIAEDNSWEYEYIETDLTGLLSGAESGEFDVSVSSLTITSQREMVMDFSTPYYVESIGLATTREPVWYEKLASKLFAGIKAVGALLFVIFGVGSLYFLIERGKSIPDSFQGWINSGYWSTATVTTVGYGDEAPKTIKGRLFAIVWMLCGFIVLGWVIALFSNTMDTGSEFNIKHPQELRDYHLATVDGSVSSNFLDENRIRHKTVSSVGTLTQDLLDANTATDFIAYDRTILLYLLADEDSVTVLDTEYQRQNLGFAFPTDSKLIEPVNIGILHHTETDWWKQEVFEFTN